MLTPEYNFLLNYSSKVIFRLPNPDWSII